MNALTLRHEQALVIGDGLTGLLTAQALTRFFRQVVVVEQPPAAGPPYLLNGRDQAALDELFPGLLAGLIAAGAVRFNLGLHVAWSVNGRWRPRYRSAYEPVICQPDLLLAALRKRLMKETAVQFRPAAYQFQPETTADLIVDTTGQADSTQTRPALLAGAGRLYQWPDGRQTSWQMLVIEPDEPATAPRRGAVVFPFVARQFYLALWGTAADPPPLDEATFMTFARSLPNPDLAEMLVQAEPLTAVTHLPTANWSIRTAPDADRVQLPQPGYLPNPLLGQPVSHALAVQAALIDSLTENRESAALSATENGRFHRSLTRHLVRHLARHVRPVNQLVQAEARRWAGLNTGRGDLAPYLARLTAGSLHSGPLLETLYAVQQGLVPPTRLFEPDVVLQTIT
jgi:hypothetical protein